MAAAVQAIGRTRIDARDLVIGISASGRAPFVLAALREAKRLGATTAILCCRPPPRASAHHAVVMNVGPEIVAGSTRLKAGTATKLALNTLSTAALVRLGRVRDGRMVALRGTNRKLRERAIGIVRDLASVTAREARARLEACDWDVARALALTRRAPTSRS